MTRCAARTRHLSLPTLPCQFPLRRIALEGPTVGVRLLISLVALAIGSLAANAQIIDRDTVIDRDTTLVGARVQSDVHLTIVGGVTVTVTHGPGGGLSTEGGRITINPGATIVLDTGGITVTSSEASVGSLEADGATIRTASESQQYALIVTGATTSITNCRLDGLAFGSYGTPITTDDESGYFVLQDNQVDSRYRDGLLHIGDGSADISGNTFLFEGGSRSRAVRLLVKDGDVVFENNELTLTGDSGGSAVSVSAGTNAFIEVIDNDILTTRPLGASGGISMLQCAQDNPQVLVTRNRVVGFTTALLADGCRTEISENVVDGTGAPSFSRVVTLRNAEGEFRGNQIRNFSFDASSSGYDEGRLLYASSPRPILIEGNLFEGNGLSEIAPTDFYLGIVYVEGAVSVLRNQFLRNRLSSARNSAVREPAALSVARHTQYSGPVEISGNLFRANTFLGDVTSDLTGSKGALLNLYFDAPVDTILVVGNDFDGGDLAVTGLHMSGLSDAYVRAAVVGNSFVANRIGAFTHGSPDFTGDNTFRNNHVYHLKRSMSSRDTLRARSNDWGTTNPLEIDALIYDDEEANNINVGPVDFGDSRHEEFVVTLSPGGPLELAVGGRFEISVFVTDLAHNPREVPVHITREVVVGEEVVRLDDWAADTDKTGRAEFGGTAYGPGIARLRAHAKDATSEPVEVSVSGDKIVVIRGARGELLPDRVFTLEKVSNDPPHYPATFLADVVTDDEGTFQFNLKGATPIVRVSKHLFAQSARKHRALLRTAYSVVTDNAAFDTFGSMSYDTLDASPEQEITLGHTEFRYNLVVSVEWDATLSFHESLEKSFRSASNFLYDVTDGQARLDTVMIYDDAAHWEVADVWISANNVLRANAHYGGLLAGFTPSRINLARKEYRGFSWGRNLTEDEQSRTGTLDVNTTLQAGIFSHEFGHYAFRMWDEYMFFDQAKNTYVDDSAQRCSGSPDLGPPNFGFMERPWISPLGSEMSSANQYGEADCRNTEHYRRSGRSCWATFEWNANGYYGPNGWDKLVPRSETDVYVDVIKPTDDERGLPVGFEFFAGPNDGFDPAAPAATTDVDVGALVVFPRTHSAPTAIEVHVEVVDQDNNPVPRSDIVLVKPNRRLEQGQTSDGGRIFVLGAVDTDLLEYTGAGFRRLGGKQDPLPARQWLSGRATLTGSTDLQLQAREVAGEFPLIAALRFDGEGQVSYHLSGTRAFPGAPSLTLSTDGRLTEYDYSASDADYAVPIPDSLAATGVFTTEALDDSSLTFFIPTPFALTRIGAEGVSEMFGPEALAQFRFGSKAAAIEKALLLGSRYPARRDGLEADEYQAGKTYAAAIHPAAAGGPDFGLTIWYDDAELALADGSRANEATLRIFRWNPQESQWHYLGGVVDTVSNAVSSAVPGQGVYGAFTTARGVGIDNGEEPAVPDRFNLQQNYPNPFNPITTIVFDLAETSEISLTVFDVLGRRVAQLASGSRQAGRYTVAFDARHLPSGVYVYTLNAGGFSDARAMILAK